MPSEFCVIYARSVLLNKRLKLLCSPVVCAAKSKPEAPLWGGRKLSSF